MTVDEQEFRKHADTALETLRKRLLDLGDAHNFEVEGEGDKLELLFEEPEEARFVISPNTAARQIWISALSTSFKLAWSDAAGAFVMDKTGETLAVVMSRILTQQLGSAVSV
jgi:iron donor protein CyaY